MSVNRFIKPESEITPSTLAVLPKYHELGKLGSIILEDEREYFVPISPSQVMDRACKFFGATLRGRQLGTREISGMTHKVPIAVDPFAGLYFLPTLSPSNPQCVWLAHTHIHNVHALAHQRSEVYFTNGLSVELDVSYGSMINQVNRTAQFRYMLDNRLKKLHEKKDDRIE